MVASAPLFTLRACPSTPEQSGLGSLAACTRSQSLQRDPTGLLCAVIVFWSLLDLRARCLPLAQAVFWSLQTGLTAVFCLLRCVHVGSVCVKPSMITMAWCMSRASLNAAVAAHAPRPRRAHTRERRLHQNGGRCRLGGRWRVTPAAGDQAR